MIKFRPKLSSILCAIASVFCLHTSTVVNANTQNFAGTELANDVHVLLVDKAANTHASAVKNKTTKIPNPTLNDAFKPMLKDVKLSAVDQTRNSTYKLKQRWPSVLPTITHATCLNPFGTISVSIIPLAGTSNYTYIWLSNGNVISNALDPGPLSAGDYEFQLTFQAANGSTESISAFYSIAYEVVWTDLIEATAVGNNLQATNSDVGEFAGAASVAVLPAMNEGWAEFQIPNVSIQPGHQYSVYFGLSESNTGNDALSIDYRMHFFYDTNGETFVAYGNQNLSGSLQPFEWGPGDRVRAIRKPTTIEFELRPAIGPVVPLTIMPFVPFSSSFVVDVSIPDGTHELHNASTSFACQVQVADEALPYYQMNRKQTGSYAYTFSKKIGVRFWEEYSVFDVPLNYRIIDPKTNAVVYQTSDGLSAPQFNVSYGTNDLDFNFCDFSLSTGTYVLEIQNAKKESWFLRFQHNDTSACN